MAGIRAAMGFIDPQVSLDDTAFVHPTAHLYGKIAIAAHASLWINVAMRAEMHEIVIGEYTNVQDFVMVHVGEATPTIVGAQCSITHHVTLHGCTIGDNCLIGINATLMDGVVVGENTIVAGHTILTEGTVVPPNSIVAGVPGKVIRSRNNFVRTRLNAFIYYRNARAFREGRYREWSSPAFAEDIAREIRRLEALVSG